MDKKSSEEIEKEWEEYKKAQGKPPNWGEKESNNSNKKATISAIPSIFSLVMAILFVANLFGAFTPAPETGENLTEVNESGNSLITLCMAAEGEDLAKCDPIMLNVREPCKQWPKLDRCSDPRVDQYLMARNLA